MSDRQNWTKISPFTYIPLPVMPVKVLARHVYALSQKLGRPLPAWVPLDQVTENWLSTAWEARDGILL
jgi:hypothetical protein